MRHVICSIRDAAIEAYGRPFFVPTKGAAIRAFQDEVNRQDNTNDLAKHPEDHDLFVLGYFDDNTGRFEPLDVPQVLIKGKEVKTAA